MAVAIDTLALAQALIPRLQRYLDQYSGRFQIHRVCAHATVIHDASAFRCLLESRERLAKQEALDWQADQGDDVHEGEVFHHLQQQVAKSPLLSRTHFTTTTLVASALSPSFTANTQGRPASSFHRQSLRCSFLRRDKVLAHAFAYSTSVPEVFPNAGEHYAWVYFPEPDFKIVWARNTGYKPFVVWNLQLDVVDLCSRITTFARPGKRRRSALNPFLQVSEPAGSGGDGGGVPEAKKFRGVRFRPERKTWVAEMRPPRSKHKASFGDFKTQTEAARAVDAAFHHYGKPHLLNFPVTTPALLSSRPTAAGLDAKATLALVKEHAKWLASIDSTQLPATNSIEAQEAELPTATATSPDLSLLQGLTTQPDCRATESSSRSCSAILPKDFHSEVSSTYEEADDGIFQPYLCPVAEESMLSWSLDLGLVENPIETYSDFSSGMVKSFVNYDPLQSCMEFLMMSPPSPMLHMATSSPSNYNSG